MAELSSFIIWASLAAIGASFTAVTVIFNVAEAVSGLGLTPSLTV